MSFSTRTSLASIYLALMLLLAGRASAAVFGGDDLEIGWTGGTATCGYDLRATPDRCPECGSVPTTAKGATT